MRNVKINVFKTMFWIELLCAVYCRHVKVYCKLFPVALGKTVLGEGGGAQSTYGWFISLMIPSL